MASVKFLILLFSLVLTNSILLSGSIDIIVIDTQGVLKSSPFSLRFSLLHIIDPSSVKIHIQVNDQQTSLTMLLSLYGVAYFPDSSDEDKYTPSSQQLSTLPLRKGKNKIAYQVNGAEEEEIISYLYLWESDVKIVISDLDGTITRSDLLGYFLPMVGMDYSQKNIVRLYNDISLNNYQIIYLTARAIGESAITRKYINTLKQDDQYLPEGPILLSPNGLLNKFMREVYYREPQKFKIPCLQSIKALFPENFEPFHAGFGNRDSDAISYRSVGIKDDLIFIVNSQGIIHMENTTSETTSYKSLDEEVGKLFPILNE